MLNVTAALLPSHRALFVYSFAIERHTVVEKTLSAAVELLKGPVRLECEKLRDPHRPELTVKVHGKFHFTHWELSTAAEVTEFSTGGLGVLRGPGTLSLSALLDALWYV